MAWYVYILENPGGRRYVGYTGRSPELRVGEHNAGLSRWTRAHRPWRLVFSKAYGDKSEAIRQERYLKTGAGRRETDRLVGLAQWIESAGGGEAEVVSSPPRRITERAISFLFRIRHFPVPVI